MVASTAAPEEKPKTIADLSVEEKQGILQLAQSVLPQDMWNRLKFDPDLSNRVYEMALAKEPPPERTGLWGGVLNLKDGAVDFLTNGIFTTALSAVGVGAVTYALGRFAPKMMQLQEGTHEEALAPALRFATMSGAIGALFNSVGSVFTVSKRYEETRAIWHALHNKENVSMLGGKAPDAANEQLLSSSLPLGLPPATPGMMRSGTRPGTQL